MYSSGGLWQCPVSASESRRNPSAGALRRIDRKHRRLLNRVLFRNGKTIWSLGPLMPTLREGMAPLPKVQEALAHPFEILIEASVAFHPDLYPHQQFRHKTESWMLTSE
jgi:hypothetical protein